MRYTIITRDIYKQMFVGGRGVQPYLTNPYLSSTGDSPTQEQKNTLSARVERGCAL